MSPGSSASSDGGNASASVRWADAEETRQHEDAYGVAGPSGRQSRPSYPAYAHVRSSSASSSGSSSHQYHAQPPPLTPQRFESYPAQYVETPVRALHGPYNARYITPSPPDRVQDLPGSRHRYTDSNSSNESHMAGWDQPPTPHLRPRSLPKVEDMETVNGHPVSEDGTYMIARNSGTRRKSLSLTTHPLQKVVLDLFGSRQPVLGDDQPATDPAVAELVVVLPSEFTYPTGLNIRVVAKQPGRAVTIRDVAEHIWNVVYVFDGRPFRYNKGTELLEAIPQEEERSYRYLRFVKDDLSDTWKAFYVQV